ncbi:helix-turn-helix domain-containing protein [Streptomyces odontomachi]|uniref:helix-turn-helix domain-containing protein n=1 Tax=Streptomyces odontomachi TaxID=2944940 RepID=UPI00210D635B|nr:helix-turn-helix transcriptional regulator [Streptomyces sp. ODS25]
MPLDPLPDWVLARRRAIGDRIRAARLHANLSQVALGERIGRDHKTIHRYEYGTSVATVDDLILIADACGVPLAQLVGEGPAHR